MKHEIKKKEKLYEKLKEKLQQLLTQKNIKSKIEFQNSNLLSNNNSSKKYLLNVNIIF